MLILWWEDFWGRYTTTYTRTSCTRKDVLWSLERGAGGQLAASSHFQNWHTNRGFWTLQTLLQVHSLRPRSGRTVWSFRGGTSPLFQGMFGATCSRPGVFSQ